MHRDDDAALNQIIDWDLMRARMWNNTPDEPDRMERRMAECLVHGSVPWEGILAIATKTQVRADQVRAMTAAATHQPHVLLKPDWYY